jgi:hypothetical protein
MELNKLYSLLQQLSNIPSDSNEAFVLDYKITQGFSFVVSSKKLLEKGIGKELISADITFKILRHGITVFSIGSVNRETHFQLIALGVSTSQTEEDFTFIFQTIKNRVLDIFKVQMDPQIILCNIDKTISNAFLSVFGANVVVLTSWIHIRETIKRNIKRYFVEELQKEALDDVNRLQLSSSPEALENASQLFLQKYAAYEEFVSYFKYEWLQQFRNWYVGAAKDNVRTNSALEMFNSNLRRHKTFHESSSFENSLVMLFESVEHLSHHNVF